jgi:hypothetical protein
MTEEPHKKKNKWIWTVLLLLVSVLITYFTKIWFLFLLFPIGMYTFKKK